VDAEAIPVEGGASPVWLAAGGVAGTMVGLAGGLVVGSVLAGPSEPGCESFCSNGEIVGAGLAGESLGAALGVHLANGRRGSLPLGMLASAGILAAGVAGMQADRRVAYLIPFSQVLGAVYVERRTSRPR
jgi:ABC-type thiamin/hydroxymethylpyrimidine transport system permease subunit